MDITTPSIFDPCPPSGGAGKGYNPPLPWDEVPATKTCSKCGRTLPLEEFGKNNATKDKHMHICKECYRPIYLSNLARAQEANRNGNLIPRRGIKKTLSLNDFTDIQLAAELSRRGYNGSITKTDTLNI